MDLGVRQIRTAGKGSGSIELTLPAELRDLVGLPCRILLSDGSRPDIVLQPDLRRARATFETLWRAMAGALLRDEADPPPLPAASFGYGLQPRAGGGELPYLSWRDGLVLATAAPHEPAAVARCFAAFGQAMAPALHIDPALSTWFGAACGYLLAGVHPSFEAQEAGEIVAAALHDIALPEPDSAAVACAAGVLSDTFWRHAAPRLAATADLFLGWTANPAGQATLRAAWRRGRAIEMSGG